MTTYMPTPPTPPRRENPESFADDGDAFMGYIPTMAAALNAIIDELNAASSSAIGQAEAALAAVNAPAWVSGTTYSVGQCVYSPVTHYSYRRKVAGAGTTDPSADSANWQVLNSGISASGTDTLTNKTIAYASNTLTGVQPTLVSGTSIKTVNSTSLLGSGNVSVQPTLVSGTNIKTINGASILGSGNVVALSNDVGFNTVGSFVLGCISDITSDGSTYSGASIKVAQIKGMNPAVNLDHLSGSTLSGTWRCLGGASNAGQPVVCLFQRIS